MPATVPADPVNASPSALGLPALGEAGVTACA